ncbi:hypothetical protein [Stenotrophomonas maltophilia]|uniref:hypothetical protein n=1 Tax=Stenotrophomonas maltophilia TaxID=40324 RepID=UPI0039C290C8
MADNSVPPNLDIRAVAQAVSESLDNPPRVELANDTHWTEMEWEGNPLHISLKAQLERADRCIAGASSLASLMHRLSIGAADVQNTPPEDGVRVVYPDVGANEMDRLWLALNELIDYAELSIEKVRGHQEVRRG